MKILYVTTIFNTAQLFLTPHIQFLIEEGHEVSIATNPEEDDISLYEKIGCKVYPIPFSRNPLNKQNYVAYKSIKNLIRKENYDLVHVHTPVASFLTRFACRKGDKPKVIYTAHGFHFYKGAPIKNKLLYYPLERLAARWTDGIITMNEEDYRAAQSFKLKGRKSVFKVSGVGINLNKFKNQTLETKMRLRKEYGFSQNDFILVCIGELKDEKHQEVIIQALGELKNKMRNTELLLVGAGSKLKSLKNLASSLQVEDQVYFLGYREDIPQLLTISDVAISASSREGLPVNVMEAMAVGLPLIVTNCRGNRDLVNDGENGLVFPINDVPSCARSIERLYYSQYLQKQFSIKNQELVFKYSLEQVLRELKDIYKQFVDVKEMRFDITDKQWKEIRRKI